MTLAPEDRAAEIAALTEQLEFHRHIVKMRALKTELADHEARARYWEKIEFLTPGRIAKEGYVNDKGEQVQPEYHRPEVIGAGYRIMEDHAVVAYVALDGKPLRHGEPSHEHRVCGDKLTACPY